MPWTAGSHLNHYELIQTLGAGGMGEVWLATDTRLQRKVAIKLLPPALTDDPARTRRFEQEARAASALNHPNVCTIHALEQADSGQHFIVMEYIEGQTLRARLAGGRMPLREALDTAIQIASSLTAAHAAGVVHRDVKPENVTIRPGGLVKVLDFGLAKLMAHDSNPDLATQTATAAGIVLGTAPYMSPEQARGLTVDARTDVWSLGVVLYEMVAARPPFAGRTTSDIIAAILERDYEPLSRLAADVPAELARIVGKALRKDPEHRYQVMKDLLLDLEALRDEMARPAVSAESASASSRGHRRRRWAVALICVSGLLAVMWWYRLELRLSFAPRPDPPGPVDRPLTRLTFDQGLQTDAAFSPDGRWIAYASDHGGNFDIWVQAVDGGQPRQLTRSPAPDTQPAWSPDGKSIVFRSERDPGGLYRVSSEGGPETQLTSFGVHPVWSANGKQVLFRASTHAGGHTALHSVSADGGEPPHEVAQAFSRSGNWTWLAPHPDGRVSAIGLHLKSGQGFYTASSGGGGVVASRPGKDGQWTQLAQTAQRFQWNADGTALYLEAVLNEVRNVWRVGVDPDTLEWVTAERITAGAGQDVAAALAPDGSRMALSVQQQTTRLWAYPLDASAGRTTGEGTPFTPEDARAQNASISPDGRLVAFVLVRAGRSQGELMVTDVDTQKTEAFATSSFVSAWSPDSSTLAYELVRPDLVSPREIALAVRKIGGAERIVRRWTKDSNLHPTGWTRDGRFIVGSYQSPAFSGRAKLAIWPASPSPEQTEHLLIEDPRSSLWQGSFSPNGRWLTFVSLPLEDPTRVGIFVAREGAAPAAWIRIAPNHAWADKPRWSPDGRFLYFVSDHGSPYFNLWGVRFDPDRGTPIGDPRQITKFDTPRLKILPDIVFAEIGISAQRAVLPMQTVRGNIWIMENVDR
jgi:serine/threonine protein kinase